MKSLFVIIMLSLLNASDPVFGERQDFGEIEYNSINEASGMVVSNKNENVFWTHNDSGDQNRIYAFNETGQHLGVFYLNNCNARDWEDIAIGPGPDETQDYLYVGEIGDNGSQYDTKYIYRLLEPDVESDQAPVNETVTNIDIIAYQYEDGNRDAETLILDPLTKDIIIVSKREEAVHIYKLPYPQSSETLLTAELIHTMDFDPDDSSSLARIVAGDISRDGTEILIKSYVHIFHFPRYENQTFSEALTNTMTQVEYIEEIKGEAVAWHQDGFGYFTISEEASNIPCHLYFYPRIVGCMDQNSDNYNPYALEDDESCISSGCTDSEACNYDEAATSDDGSCEYYNTEIMCDCEGSFLDINGDCCSELMMDECWICNGNGSSCLDSDSDGDGCNDDIDDAPYEWDDDYDGDDVPDDCDDDDDNDGVEDNDDPDDNNEFECSDNDGDTCDDCGSGTYDTTNDGEDYDSDGLCNLGDMDDDGDGTIDSEDCAPLYELASELDCAGICGGDNSTYYNCCGTPPGPDCTDECVMDENGGCCMSWDLDDCGICDGDNACLSCENPFIYIGGHCLHQDDLSVLQDMIDNSLNSGHSFDYCYNPDDPWCQSPNLYMDQSDNWHWVEIDGVSYQFSNDNGVVEPLELGLQEWADGRLTSLMCGAYIYCQLSGEIPSSISDLTEINILRLEVNYFFGEIPESVCELENINFSDNLAFDFSYNMLCPPYPDCVEDGAVQYMDTSECGLNGDVNDDGVINVLDIVSLVNAILNNVYIDGGDINDDGLVNVQDVIILVNIILGV